MDTLYSSLQRIYIIQYFSNLLRIVLDWVIPEKIHTFPTDGKLEIQVGGGMQARKFFRGSISWDLPNESRGKNIPFHWEFAVFSKGKFC